jgi:dsDNA-specific endonuclease/ATPase MutS2
MRLRASSAEGQAEVLQQQLSEASKAASEAAARAKAAEEKYAQLQEMSENTITMFKQQLHGPASSAAPECEEYA